MKAELEYTINKVIDTDLLEDPYPYMEIKGIFSDDFYSEMISNKPKGVKHFSPLSKIYDDRFVLELAYGENVNKEVARIPFEDPKQKSFWEEFQNLFVKDRSFANCIFDKYSKYVNKARAARSRVNCRLSKDLKGYSIGVHRDKKDKVVSCLFYLPDNGELSPEVEEDWGTQILTPKKEMNHTDDHHKYNNDGSHDLFNVFKTVTFEPNKMFSWCVTYNSYHGVSPISHDGERDSIAFFMKSK
tara:strand:- start:51 stop:779 length:729 start_codon:yes stop_codon:yes gene_type:complete